MLRGFPEGWFQNNLLWWGEGLTPEACFARGAIVEVPDLRLADRRTILALRQQNNYLLASLGESNALQIHWSVEDDYFGDLERYDRHTALRKREGRLTRWCEDRRNNRSNFYRAGLRRGERRRERVYIYVAQRCTDLNRSDLTSLRTCEGYVQAQTTTLEAKLAQMQMSYPLARWRNLDDRGHCLHLRKVLNPGIASLMSEDEDAALKGFDPNRSVRQNCLRTDMVPFSYGRSDKQAIGLNYAGHFHGLFVITRLPARTRPGMMLPLLSANARNCTVVQNIYPLEVNAEIARLRTEIFEKSRYVGDRKSLGVENEILALQTRMNALFDSVIIPYKCLSVIRVWSRTMEGLAERSLAVDMALQKLDGCEFHRVNDEVRARHLYLETLPGHLGSTYREWDKYVENRNLVDFMPISSTFTGHLGEDTQVLLDSPSGGIVGLRALAQGVPQHTTLTGVNGAGKTALILELLSQLECDAGYIYLQEEGMAMATYAKVRGIPSVVLKNSSEFTLNPFDTFGLPLTAGNIATVKNTCMKLIGLSRDEDKNKRRANLVGEYVARLYRDTAEGWKIADEDRWYGLTKRAVLADRIKRGDDDFLDGCVSLRELERTKPDQVAEALAGLQEADVIAYQTKSLTRDNVLNLVFSQLKPDDYPQFATLVSLMRSARLPPHRSGGIADELNYLTTDLAQGKRTGGSIGPLIDGVTNIPLHGAGLHLDTGYLSDGPLKELAGYLFPEMVRQHVMGLPRAALKVMVLDELRRLLLIPGAGEHIREMLAQMRKYKTWLIPSFQAPSQIDEIDPSLTALLFGQCKQHFLMRQNDASEIARIAEAIGLPEAGQRSIAAHPLLEHQLGTKASYFTLFSKEGTAPVCGTVRVEVDPYMLYVATSNGEVFDQKGKALKQYPDPTTGVYEEVNASRESRRAAPPDSAANAGQLLTV